MRCVDDFLWERRRKQQRLFSLCHSFNTPHDVREEPHIKHTVGFIQTKERGLAQIDVSSFSHIHDATGRTNDDVDTVSESFGLLLEVSTSVNGENLQSHGALQRVEFFGNLTGQFSCWRQDEGLQCPCCLASLHNGKAKGSGFARPGSCLANHVVALTSQWNGVALDLGRKFPSSIRQSVQKQLRQRP